MQRSTVWLHTLTIHAPVPAPLLKGTAPKQVPNAPDSLSLPQAPRSHMCPSLTLKTLFSLLEVQGDSLVTTSFQPGLRCPSLIPGLTRTTPVAVTPKITFSCAPDCTTEIAGSKTHSLSSWLAP